MQSTTISSKISFSSTRVASSLNALDLKLCPSIQHRCTSYFLANLSNDFSSRCIAPKILSACILEFSPQCLGHYRFSYRDNLLILDAQ